MRLNLGCGRIPTRGYVNVDLREYPGVDIATDLDQRGCLEGLAKTGSVDEVFAGGLLEHLPHYENLVMEIARVLRPGGLFYFRVPHRRGHAAYTPYHVRFFDEKTFDPWRSDWLPRNLDLIHKRTGPHNSLEFGEPLFTLQDRWIEHWVPFSWHVEKYLGIPIGRAPLGPVVNVHEKLRRNDRPFYLGAGP